MAEKTKRYCAFCTKMFVQLRLHTKRSHPNQRTKELIMDKKQSCPHCKLSLSHAVRSSFINHVRGCYLNPARIYNRPDAPFQCPNCMNEGIERKFNRKRNLVRHLKLKHTPDGGGREKEAAGGSKTDPAPPGLVENIYDLINGQLDPKLLIDFETIDQQEVERLNMMGTKFGFRFTELCRKLASYGFFVECISSVFKYLIDVEGIRKNYLLGISLESPSELEYPIPLPLMRGQDFKLEFLLNQIEMVIQSHSSLGLDSDIVLNVVTLPDPLSEEYLKRKYGILDPSDLQYTSIEHTCLPLCVAIYARTQNIPKKIALPRITPPIAVATQTQDGISLLSGGNGGAAAGGNGGGEQKKKWQRFKTKKLMGWENHRERINGYYFSLEGEEREESEQREGSYYCFVGIYRDAVVIHIRVYIETSAGDLIPTKEGCCLDIGEFKKLAELGPVCLDKWQESGKGKTMRHALSHESDWFLLIGENDQGYIRIAIKLLLATNKVGEFETLNKGAVLSVAQFGRFCDQLSKISDAVQDMRGYLKPEE